MFCGNCGNQMNETEKCIEKLGFALEMMDSFFDTYVVYDPERENVITLHDAMELVKDVKTMDQRIFRDDLMGLKL